MPLISHQRDPAGIKKPEMHQVADNTNIINWLVDTYRDQAGLCGDLACSFVLNGKEIFRTDHENKDESLIDISLSNNDSLIIINRPAITGFIAAYGAYISAAVAVVSLAISIYTYLNMPELGSAVGANDSPNSRLSAGSNSFRPYQGIPEIFGTGVAYPDFIQNPYYYYEDNIKKQVELFCLTTGRAKINGVNIGTTNIDSIAESTATFYEPGETVPQEFLTIHSQSTEVDGQVAIAPDDDSILKTGQTVTISANATSTTISIDDSDYDDTTFLYDTSLEVGDYLYIRSSSFNGVFEITAILSLSSPAIISIDRAGTIPLYTDIDASVGRGNPEGVIGGGLFGTIDNSIGWYELAGSEVEEIWFNWIMPVGLRSAGGSTRTMTVRFDIETIVNDIPTGNVWSKTVSLTKNTPDAQFNTLRFTRSNTSGMPAGKFQVRMKRITPVIDFNGAALEKVQLETVSSVTPYYNSDFGDTTTLLVQRKATLYSADQSSKKINIEYTRKLPSYNRLTGEYDENNLVETKSFADAAAYTLIAAGNETTDTVDLAELYAIYDGLSDSDLGEFSYTFDDADLSKGERVDNICKSARVVSFHDGIKWRFSRDEVKPIRSALFNRRSTVGNEAKQSWQTQRSDDSDSVRVIYVDASSNTEAYVDRAFNTVTGEIIEGEVGFNLKEINLAGCRNVTQATNRANLEIRRLAYQRRSVTETTYRDALTIDLLDRVGWVDINDIDTFDGEIIGIDGDTYDTTERFEPIDGESYVVFITDVEGYPSNTVVCIPRLDTEFGFTAVGISDAYVASGDQQISSRYFIANADDLEASNFTLTSRTPNNDNTVTVELAEYRIEMYEKDGDASAKEPPQIPAGLTALNFEPSGTPSTSTLTFQTDGVIDLNGTLTSWYSAGVVADIGDFFEVKATLISGTANGAFNTWTTIESNQAWSTTETIDDSSETAVISFTVRQVGYTTSSATNDITITATIGKNVDLPDLITVSEEGVTQAITTINFNSDGTYTGSDGISGTYTTITDNIGELYEIMATTEMQANFPTVETTIMGVLDSDVAGEAFEEWNSLEASGASWSLATTLTKTASFYVTIRRVDDIADADTCIVTLNATVTV